MYVLLFMLSYVRFVVFLFFFFFFFQAEDGIRDRNVTGVQTCALPIWTFHMPISVSDLRCETSWTNSAAAAILVRSEERRVGKECRCRWWREHSKKKKENRNREQRKTITENSERLNRKPDDQPEPHEIY